MDEEKPPPPSAARGLIFEAISGVQGAGVTPTKDTDVRDMLRAVGGTSAKTRSGIDLSAAAKALKVSRRTVERWVKSAETGTGQRPSAVHHKQLVRRARQQASTRAGRRRTLSASPQMQSMARKGGRIHLDAFQGPRDRKYRRQRTVVWDLSPEDAQEMMGAYEKDGEQGLSSWAASWADTNYVDGWGIEGPISGLKFT